jgi:hypothetical protein
MNGCTGLSSTMSRHSPLIGANRTILIFSWSSITACVPMKRWDERLRRVFIVSRHVLTQEKFHPLNTVPGRRFGACATTARSNGKAISFTYPRCWLKSRLDSSRSRKKNGRFVIVSICSVRSINEQTRSCQLKTGTVVTSKKCKPCARLICKGSPACTALSTTGWLMAREVVESRTIDNGTPAALMD